jgi:hypothetical protein
VRTILRILIILALAVGISGIAYLAVNASSGSTSGQQAAGNGGRQVPDAGFVPGNGQPPAGFQRGGDFHGGAGDRNGSGSFSSGEMLKNIGICAAFILAAVVIEQLARKLWRKKLRPVPVKVNQAERKE